MKRSFFIIAITVVAIIPCSAQIRIAVIGSSTAAGYGVPTGSSWVDKMRTYYSTQGTVDFVFNLAVGGTNNYQGMPMWFSPSSSDNYGSCDDPPGPVYDYSVTRALSMNPQPDIVIVNYPSNWYDCLPISKILFTLQTMKEECESRGVKCYIATSQPRDDFNSTGRAKLRVIRDSILNRFGDAAIDFFTDIATSTNRIRSQYRLGDNVHINEEGHNVLWQKVLAKNILENLIPDDILPVKLANVSAKWSEDGKLVIVKYTILESNNLKHVFINVKKPDGTAFKFGPFEIDTANPNREYIQTIQIE